MRRPLLAVLACALWASPGWSLPAWAAPVALDDLVQRALVQAPALRAAGDRAEAEDARAQAARGAYWPQLTLNGAYARTTSVSPAQTSTQPFDLSSGNLGLRQELFTFGRTAAQVAGADAQAEAARFQAQSQGAEVAYAVRQAYMQWLQARGLEGAAQVRRRDAEQVLAQAEAFYKAGVRAKLDVTRARVAVAQARAAQVAARTATQQAARSLSTTVGQRAPIAGEPQFPPVPPIARSPLADLSQRAQASHPRLLQARARVRQAEAAREEADRNGLPTLNLDASAGARARDGVAAPNWQAGLSAAWPIFSGFSLTRQREAASALERAAASDYAEAEQQILLGLERAVLARQGAEAQLAASTEAASSARENLQQAAGRYRAGVGSIIEESDAQAQLASAEADMIRDRTAYHQAIADLWRALGETGVAP